MTDEQLNAIDAIVSAPAMARKTYCAHAHPEEELLDGMLREQGFTSYANLPCLHERRKYEKSLWLRMSDGRSAPELYVLATLKFGVLGEHARPYWLDGDSTNNVLDNVGVALGTHIPQTKRLAKNAQERYWANPVNQEKHRERARRYAAKQREILKRAKNELDPTTVQRVQDELLAPDGRRGPDDDRMLNTVPDPGDSDIMEDLDAIVRELSREEEEDF